ncbi:MAG: hypothetical protein Q7S65_05665 [Nanoarchaeota archaeon]|nr:hypothetical protein [Nanoarchaeota archaeon]
MKKEPVSYRKHLSRVSATRTIEDLEMAFKNFIHEQYDIHHGHTFTEIQNVAGKKRIHPHLREHIRSAAQMFEEMAYRKKKLSKHELHHIRKHVHALIKSSRDAYGPSAEPEKGLFARVKRTRDTIVQKTKENVQRLRHKDILVDAEYREMRKFMDASHKLGMGRSQIETELLVMGFPKEKVEKLLK